MARVTPESMGQWRARISRERTELMDGLRALVALEEHAGITLDLAGRGTSCPQCMRFAIALLRGVDVADACRLRCQQAQNWHAQVNRALAILKADTEADIEDDEEMEQF